MAESILSFLMTAFICVLDAVNCALMSASAPDVMARGKPSRMLGIDVAVILAEEGGEKDQEVIQAAILCELGNWKNLKLDEIQTQFGERVARAIAEVRGPPTQRPSDRAKSQLANLRSLSVDARVIVLAEILSTLRDLTLFSWPDWGPVRIHGYATWCCELVCKGYHGSYVYDNLIDSIRDILADGEFKSELTTLRLCPESDDVERRRRLDAYYRIIDSHSY